MPEELPVVRATFALVGDPLDFDALIALGLPDPLVKRRRGQAREGELPPAPETIWAYEVKERSDTIERPVSRVVSNLEPYQAQIAQALSTPGVEGKLLINVTIEGTRPLYCLSAELLSRLAQFSVELCIDIFDYSE